MLAVPEAATALEDNRARATAEMEQALTPDAGADVRIRKGWRSGPYNRVMDPLPYNAIPLPVTARKAKAKPAPGSEAADDSKATKHNPPLQRVWASTRDSLRRAIEDGVMIDGSGDRLAVLEVKEEQLVALPFKPPRVWTYVYDIVSGTWELVLYILVMLLAIMLETNVRYFRSGSDYDRWWVYLYKVVVVCYPAGIMVFQFSLVCEYALRKFIFFRLLSLGIMVQAERRTIWRSWYFAAFVAVWAILNVWAWWGLITWWGRNGKSGPEYLSFAVMGVVNVVSFHLLMHYKRLMEEQKRILKPLQAYLLPDVVVVSEYAVKKEGWRVLRTAVFSYCWPGPKGFDIEWIRQQGVRIPRTYTGPAEAAEAAVTKLGEDAQGDDTAAFATANAFATAGSSGSDRDLAAAVAPVQEGGMERDTHMPEMMGGAEAGAAEVPAVGAAQASADIVAADAAAAATVVRAEVEVPKAAGGGLPEGEPAADGEVAISGTAAAGAAAGSDLTSPMTSMSRRSSHSAITGTTAGDNPDDAADSPSQCPGGASDPPQGPGQGPVAEATEAAGAVDDPVGGTTAITSGTVKELPSAANSAGDKPTTATKDKVKAAGATAGRVTWGVCRRCSVYCFRCCCCCCLLCARFFDPRNYMSGLFALPTAFLSSVLCKTQVWPFHPDKRYMRLILLTAFLSSLVVGGGIAFGAWLVAHKPPICQWGLDSCLDCLIYQEEYVDYDKVCDAGGYNITKVWDDPDFYDPNCPSGRSWFTNGVWSNNASVVTAQHGDFLNITGPALLNGYLGCIMSFYAYPSAFEGLEKGFEGQFIKRFKSLFTTYGFTKYDFVFQDDTAIYDTQFIVAGTGNDVYMIFRGTDGVTDSIITDVSSACIANTDFGAPTCAHKGFLSAYRQARERVYSGLISVIRGLEIMRRNNITGWQPGQPQPFTLWLSGHSLGGALATLCAMDLRSKGLLIDGVYTYGSPRVGDKRLRNLYFDMGLSNVTWRYVHRSDAIPQVPLQAMGFVHVTTPYMLNGGRCVIWPSEDFCAEGSTLGFCGFSGADHFLSGYLANLRACIVYSRQLPNCTEAMMPIWAKVEKIP